MQRQYTGQRNTATSEVRFTTWQDSILNRDKSAHFFYCAMGMRMRMRETRSEDKKWRSTGGAPSRGLSTAFPREISTEISVQVEQGMVWAGGRSNIERRGPR
jgi:hypothetical protein